MVGLVMTGVGKYFAEFFGTFVLVLIGCGSAVIAGQYIGYLGIAFAFGLALLAMVYTIGSISGCHINPAVTIGMFAANKIEGFEAIGYIIMQCFGAVFGAGILLMIARITLSEFFILKRFGLLLLFRISTSCCNIVI